jgi:TrmH family RNA methyltransferase
VSDPGNLGTIIRLCDWFGFSELICSETTVDCFNPKVIQASMGSIVRVQCHYVTELEDSLKSLDKPIYGATARGDSIYEAKSSGQASYVFGSESHGISPKVTRVLNGELSIPHFRGANQRAESLNVATATAIVLSELMRPPTQK